MAAPASPTLWKAPDDAANKMTLGFASVLPPGPTNPTAVAAEPDTGRRLILSVIRWRIGGRPAAGW
jgi:hypothetical protein